jgi:hypothetical protein
MYGFTGTFLCSALWQKCVKDDLHAVLATFLIPFSRRGTFVYHHHTNQSCVGAWGGFHGSQTRASESSIRLPMKQLELSARVLEVGLSSSYSPISTAPRNLNRPVTLRDFEVDRSIVTMEGLSYHVRHPSAYTSAPDRCNSTDDFYLVKSTVSLRLLM